LQLNDDGSVRWSVDTNYFATIMAALNPVPPLAFNAKLIASARGHTQWMLDKATQSHDQDGISTSQRITNAGYDWMVVAENVFAFARGVFHGHAGFEVDWGEGPHGMQDPPGHRNNNHNDLFHEVGFGVVNGSKSRVEGNRTITVGPQLVTVNFGSQKSAVPLVT